MPFTLSHAAAALPFRRTKPIWPALVIGTFAPDFQYFLWVSNDERTWHLFPEIVLCALPCALLLLWGFERYVKVPVIELLPSGVQRRLSDKLAALSFAGTRQFLSILLWIGVGIATHLAWDEFTHTHDWLPKHWGLLRMQVSLPLGHSMALAHFLQYVSTVTGLLVLGAWSADWYRRTQPGEFREQFSPKMKVTLVSAMGLAAFLVGYPVALARVARYVPPSKNQFVITVFEAVTLVFCIELLIYGLSMSWGSREGRSPAAQPEEGD